MAIADKVTSITNHLIADYEELENVGAEINDDKNIENIAYYLQGIYDNLPKTTGEGTNLSLNTLKGKMNIIPKGDTYQYSTTGANLLPYPYGETTKTSNGVTITDNGDGTLTLNGTSTDYINFYLKKATDTWNLAIGTYYLSFGHSDIGITAIIGGDTDNISYTYGTSKFSFNVVNGGNVGNKCLLQIASNKTFNNVVLKPMIAISSSATWEPYTNGASPNPTYPQDIEVVTGTQEVKVENVNLLANGVSFTKSTAGWYDQLGNETTTLAQVQASTNYYDLKGGTTYTLKVHNYTNINRCQIIYVLNGSLSAFATISNLSNSATFTPTTDTRVWFRAEMTNTNTNTIMQPQLEKRKHIYTIYTTPRTNTNSKSRRYRTM